MVASLSVSWLLRRWSRLGQGVDLCSKALHRVNRWMLCPGPEVPPRRRQHWPQPTRLRLKRGKIGKKLGLLIQPNQCL